MTKQNGTDDATSSLAMIIDGALETRPLHIDLSQTLLHRRRLSLPVRWKMGPELLLRSQEEKKVTSRRSKLLCIRLFFSCTCWRGKNIVPVKTWYGCIPLGSAVIPILRLTIQVMN